MKDFVSKIGSLTNTIIEEKGELYFFALALREEASVWDLLVAAEWIDQDRNGSLKYLVDKVQRVLTKQELLELSAIILLQSEYYNNQSIMKSPNPTSWEENNIDLYGLAVKQAYIFVSTDGYFNPRNATPSDRMPTDPYAVAGSSTI